MYLANTCGGFKKDKRVIIKSPAVITCLSEFNIVRTYAVCKKVPKIGSASAARAIYF
jgi:hypothetical protein